MNIMTFRASRRPQDRMMALFRRSGNGSGSTSDNLLFCAFKLKQVVAAEGGVEQFVTLAFRNWKHGSF